MRHRIYTAVLAAMLGPWSALAQQPEGEIEGTESSVEEEGESAPTETEGAEVVQEKGDQVNLSGKESAPGEVHTVVKGDTLWDLSQRYLGSPWYWPKVWSYNPEIANPHWIYPGNRVRFFPSGEEVPTQVEVGEGPAATPDEDLEAAQAVAEETQGVQVSGKIGYTPKAATSRSTRVGFVTAQELQETGEIDSSKAESEMLSYPDTVYLRFRQQSDAKLGERFVIFRTVKKIEHPINGGPYGYLTHFLGVAKVQKLSGKLVTAQIVENWDEIRRGDLIGPFGEQFGRSVSLRPNDKELKGFVLAALEPDMTMMGEHHQILIDRGSADGVQLGNTFTVIRQNDGLKGSFIYPQRSNEEYPVEDVAVCMTVEVKDRASTCLLMRSLREVVAGDRVEMRVGGAPAQAALH